MPKIANFSTKINLWPEFVPRRWVWGKPHLASTISMMLKLDTLSWGVGLLIECALNPGCHVYVHVFWQLDPLMILVIEVLNCCYWELTMLVRTWQWSQRLFWFGNCGFWRASKKSDLLMQESWYFVLNC